MVYQQLHATYNLALNWKQENLKQQNDLGTFEYSRFTLDDPDLFECEPQSKVIMRTLKINKHVTKAYIFIAFSFLFLQYITLVCR